MKKELTKLDLCEVIKDLRRNLEHLFSIEFYSLDEYKQNLKEIEYLELTFNN